jgi:perosamine synthetase
MKKVKKIPQFRPYLSWGTIFNTLGRSFLFNLNKKENRKFEEEFAVYVGVRNAISVPSGRTGLYLILKNLKLKENAEVILPSFTYWAIPKVISSLNLKPVFVDIDPRTCEIEASLVERSITQNTKVIIPTHLYGMPSNMEYILNIADKHNLIVIEDCVQACGAEYKGKKVGSLGDAAYFSFGVTKNMSLFSGGMVVTNEDSLAKEIRREVGEYGFLNRIQVFKKILMAMSMKLFTSPGIFTYFLFPLIYLFSSFKIDLIENIFSEKASSLSKNDFKLFPLALHNYVGVRELRRLDGSNSKRISNGTYFLRELQSIKNLSLPLMSENIINIFTNFPIRLKDRDRVIEELLKRGINTSKGYMNALADDSPNAKSLEQSILHIPIYPSLTESELLYICQAIKQVMNN